MQSILDIWTETQTNLCPKIGSEFFANQYDENAFLIIKEKAQSIIKVELTAKSGRIQLLIPSTIVKEFENFVKYGRK